MSCCLLGFLFIYYDYWQWLGASKTLIIIGPSLSQPYLHTGLDFTFLRGPPRALPCHRALSWARLPLSAQESVFLFALFLVVDFFHEVQGFRISFLLLFWLGLPIRSPVQCFHAKGLGTDGINDTIKGEKAGNNSKVFSHLFGDELSTGAQELFSWLLVCYKCDQHFLWSSSVPRNVSDSLWNNCLLWSFLSVCLSYSSSCQGEGPFFPLRDRKWSADWWHHQHQRCVPGVALLQDV